MNNTNTTKTNKKWGGPEWWVVHALLIIANVQDSQILALQYYDLSYFTLLLFLLQTKKHVSMGGLYVEQ
jgi:hypothetical protein